MKKIINWLFMTKENKLVYAQRPNWQLLTALCLWAVSIVITKNPYSNLFEILFKLMLLYWASLEIKTGVNYFRNILGTAVFALILAGLLNQLL